MKRRFIFVFMIFITSFLAAQQKDEENLLKVKENYENVPRSTDPGAYDEQPMLLYAAKPEYPTDAKENKMEAVVFVNVLLDKDGLVKKTSIWKSDNEMFNQPAIDAVMKSKFSPAKKNGEPIALWLIMPYKFSMDTK